MGSGPAAALPGGPGPATKSSFQERITQKRVGPIKVAFQVRGPPVLRSGTDDPSSLRRHRFCDRAWSQPSGHTPRRARRSLGGRNGTEGAALTVRFDFQTVSGKVAGRFTSQTQRALEYPSMTFHIWRPSSIGCSGLPDIRRRGLAGSLSGTFNDGQARGTFSLKPVKPDTPPYRRQTSLSEMARSFSPGPCYSRNPLVCTPASFPARQRRGKPVRHLAFSCRSIRPAGRRRIGVR